MICQTGLETGVLDLVVNVSKYLLVSDAKQAMSKSPVIDTLRDRRGGT